MPLDNDFQKVFLDMPNEQKIIQAPVDLGKTDQPRGQIFSIQYILALIIGFTGGFVLLHVVLRFLRNNFITFDCPTYWPISVFSPRSSLTWKHGLVALAVVAFFHFGVRFVLKTRTILRSLAMIIIVGIILLLGTNLIQGWEMAFVHPVAPPASLQDPHVYDTPKRQLYNDAMLVENASDFVSQFEQIQPNLGIHARLHPPGAVLLFFFPSRISESLSAISIGIAIVSTVLSMLFLYGILNQRVSDRITVLTTFLFILIPAVQIYYAATMDALVASFLLGALFFFLHRNSALSIAGSILFLFLALSLTFVAMFAFPVLLGFDIVRRKSFRRSAAIFSGLGIICVSVYLLTGFNYLHSFRIASTLENPHGFILLHEPFSYVFTRLEGICEILLFFGPFLGVLTLRGLRLAKKNVSDLQILAFLAIGTLLAMFATGAFNTGETARVCLFFFPYLLFPVAAYLQHAQPTKYEKLLILYLVFFQTVIMQIGGNYWW
jgi:hypothetical protein